jgi:hypothetical protein
MSPTKFIPATIIGMRVGCTLNSFANAFIHSESKPLLIGFKGIHYISISDSAGDRTRLAICILAVLMVIFWLQPCQEQEKSESRVSKFCRRCYSPIRSHHPVNTTSCNAVLITEERAPYIIACRMDVVNWKVSSKHLNFTSNVQLICSALVRTDNTIS